MPDSLTGAEETESQVGAMEFSLRKYGWIIVLLVAACALGVGIWLGR